MSAFDVDSFLDAQTTQASEKRPPLPAGSEYTATIGEPVGRSGEKDGKPWAAIDFPMVLDLPDGGSLTMKYGAFLDVTDSNEIDWSAGRNSGLRRLREATGLNDKGRLFSIRALQGRQVKVKIKHRLYEGEIYDEIGAVAKV